MSAAIISDLHLGLTGGRDLLRRPAAQEALAGALRDVDELVLLGDVVELRERPIAHVLAAARPTLAAIGRAMAGRRVTLVPGNHDHHLAAALLEELSMRDGSGQLGLETFVTPPPAGPLAEIVAGLAEAAAVRVAYPGLWVRPDVYATHGHYLDLHNTVPTFERLAIGAVKRVGGGIPPGPLTADDYEAALAPVYALTYAMAQSAGGIRSVAGGDASMRVWRLLNGEAGRPLKARVLGAVAFPAAVAGLNRAGLGPLKPDLSAAELRRAGLRGMAEVVQRLGIEAAHVVFGHTHRSGPHAGDTGWVLPGGGRLMNTGSWIHEPAFLGPSPATSPYWPGHAAIVPDSGPPQLVRLLEELP